MSFWKQSALSALVLVAAATAWAIFYPGAPQAVERVGLERLAALLPERDNTLPAEERQFPRGGFASQPALVIATPIVTETINDRLSAIGSSRAVSSVSLTPFAAGRLTEILVEPGARIKAGDAIATLDSDAEQIAVDRARLTLEDANARLERVKALLNSRTATAVQVTEAELAVRNAQLALRDAELALSRRTILAPINGVVGILPISIGNTVTTQTEVATIDDRSRIVIEFWVPERFAAMLEVGQAMSAVSIARPNEVFDGTISALDNRIDPLSRTLRVQARLENRNDVLRAGMSFQVSMAFPGDSYPAVDPLAIQWSTDGAYVWLIEDGIARRAPVRIIQRNTDSVLVSADFGTAGAVVTEGVHAVREGGEVRIVQGLSGGPDATPLTTGS